MKHTHLTLVCHASTEAQRIGRFHRADDAIVGTVEGNGPSRGHDLLLCAPELRTRQTAAGLGWQPRLDDGLRECDLGRWQGLTLKQLEAQEPEALAHWLEDPHAAPHGGESIGQLCQRVAQWMEALTAPGRCQAVTHPMVIRAALIHVLGSPLGAFHRIDVPPLSAVQFSRYGRWRFTTG